MLCRAVFLVFLSITIPAPICAFQSYQSRIPNGDKVPNPCDPSTIWKSVGHQRATEDGRLNQFGLDFLAKGKQWQTVCSLDSDGDGRTNGEELGDPNCIWQNNQTKLPDTGKAITHPGVCEPVSSSKCAANNAFLKRIPECAGLVSDPVPTPPSSGGTTAGPPLKAPDWCPPMAKEEFKTVTFNFKNFTIPQQETAYYCQQFTVPNSDAADYQIIAWEPIINNPENIHHLIVFVCDDAPSYARLTEMGGYLAPKECGMMPACQTMILSWGAGEKNRCYDPAVGVAMGKSKYTMAIVQILYNNPLKKANVMDSSGIRLYYTSRVRPNENAIILVGQEGLAIPPQTSMTSFTGRSFASTACSKKRLGLHDSYNITGALFHMHKAGVYGRLSIIKQSGQTIDILNEAIRYGNGTALVKAWSGSEAYVVEPGDNIEIECRYDTTSRTTWSFYGPNANDEMCFAYIDIYPKPLDRLFQIVDNVGRIDQCMFEEEMIGNCSMVEFHGILARILQGTGGGFLEHCGCSIFPATGCTTMCYTFLTEWSLLNHPCVTEENGMAFHVATRFTAVPLPGDSFNVLSQISKCNSLKDSPLPDVKCANAPDPTIGPPGASTDATTAGTATKPTTNVQQATPTRSQPAQQVTSKNGAPLSAPFVVDLIAALILITLVFTSF